MKGYQLFLLVAAWAGVADAQIAEAVSRWSGGIVLNDLKAYSLKATITISGHMLECKVSSGAQAGQVTRCCAYEETKVPNVAEITACTGGGKLIADGDQAASQTIAAGATFTTPLVQNFVIPKANLLAAIPYKVHCITTCDATAVGSTFYNTISTSEFVGFDQGPAEVSQVVDNVTISLRATKNDEVNCVALTDGAAAPAFVAATTAAPVVYNTVVNPTVGINNILFIGGAKPVSFIGGVSRTFTFSAMKFNTNYDVYCASKNLGMLSAKLDLYVSGFTRDPYELVAERQLTSVTIGFTLKIDDTANCVAMRESAAKPTQTTILNPSITTDLVGFGYTSPVPASSGEVVEMRISNLALFTRYDVYCASKTFGVLSNKLSVMTGRISMYPRVRERHARGGLMQITLSTVQDIACAADLVNSTAIRTRQQVYNNAPGPGEAPFAENPLRSKSISGVRTQIIFNTLFPLTEYKVYCATKDDALWDVNNPPVKLVTVGFVDSPLLAGGIKIGGFTVQARVNDKGHSIRCCAYPINTPTPYAPMVMGCQNALAAGDIVKDAEEMAYYYFTFKGIPMDTEVSTYCATSLPSSLATVSPIGDVSAKLDLKTSKFNSQPRQYGALTTHSANVELESGGASELIRCIAVPKGMVPSAENVFEGKGQGGVPAKGTSALGRTIPMVNAVISIANLRPNQELDGYCATESFAMSNRFDLKTSKVLFNLQPRLRSDATTSTVEFEVQVDAEDKVKCVLVNPNESPSAAQVFAGKTQGANEKDTNAIQVTTEAAGDKGQLLVFKFIDLVTGRSYSVICATESGSLSKPLRFRTKGGLETPVRVDFAATSPNFNISITSPVAGLLRCVALLTGEFLYPTPFDVLRGDGAPGREAPMAPSSVIAAPNIPYIFTFMNPDSLTAFDVYCANQAGSVSPVLAVVVQTSKSCNERGTCSECSNSGCYWQVNSMTSMTTVSGGACMDTCKVGNFCSPGTFVCGELACSYSAYSGYGPCSDSCGGGLKTRSRALNGGSQLGCPVTETEEATCNLQACVLPTIMKIDDVTYRVESTGSNINNFVMTFRDLKEPTTKATESTVVDTKGGQVAVTDKNHENSQRKQITLTGISTGGDLGQTLKVYATSNNPQVVKDPQVNYRSGSSVAVLSFSIPEFAQGNARVTVFVVDSGSRSTGPQKNSASFTVDIASNEIDCVVSFSDWSTCSRSCDGGVRQRYDHIDVYPSESGLQCPSPPRFEEEACQTQRCDDMCQWTWTEWSSCSPKCGVGTQHRTQVIQSPLGVCSFTPEDERRDCLSTDCPKDCKLEYSDWSGCSKTCGGGQQKRMQQVISYSEQGGLTCPAYLNEETRECNMLDCSELGATCSGYCGSSPPNSNCRCDVQCQLRGDCCKDYQTICSLPVGSCTNRCGVYTAGQCACDSECFGNGDCCNDYQNACRVGMGVGMGMVSGGRGGSSSCAGNCGNKAPSGCFCDPTCTTTGDCCSDYGLLCSGAQMNQGSSMQVNQGSCAGNCGNKAPSGCFCDPTCSTTGDCCSDYGSICGGTQQSQGGSCSGRCTGGSMGSSGFDFTGSLSMNNGQFNGNSFTQPATSTRPASSGMQTPNSKAPVTVSATSVGPGFASGYWTEGSAPAGNWNTQWNDATMPASPSMSDYSWNAPISVRAYVPGAVYDPLTALRGYGLPKAQVAPIPLGGKAQVAPIPLGGFGLSRASLAGRRLLQEEEKEGLNTSLTVEEKEEGGVDTSLTVEARAFVPPEELAAQRLVQDKQLDTSTKGTTTSNSQCQCDASCKTIGDCCWDYQIVCNGMGR